jgi:hypothetical protein
VFFLGVICAGLHRNSLGLGATVSKSTLATSREAARLKGKLVGQKRRRDADGDDDRAVGVKRPHNSQDDDDEDESRSAAISTKKARVKAARGSGLGKPEKMMDTAVSQKGKSAEEPQPLTLFSIPTDILTGAPLPTPKHTLPPIVDGTTPAGPSPSPSRHPPPSPVPSQSTPLLNLHGPPGSQMGDETHTHPQDESGGPRKKKRRRRARRRKNHGSTEAV